MRIVVLCATRRGYLFLDKLTQLVPGSVPIVFSFQEDSWEPPFLDDIRQLTLARGSQFLTAKRVGHQRWSRFWDSEDIDLMFAVSWRYMIPASVYRRPRLGTFVFHDSLLPEYRGFSPSVWAIINGKDHTGVTLFEANDKPDAGDIVDQERVPIGPDDTISVVMERATQAYLDLLERNLDGLIKGTAPRCPQDHSRATYTCRRLLEDNQIDWSASSEGIYNLIRAVSNPYPGAYTYLAGRKMRVWSARRVADGQRYVGRVPGRVIEVRPGEGSAVLTGDGALLLGEIQVEDGEIICAADVLHSLEQTLGR